MARDILYRVRARDALLRGVNVLTNTVEVTLGPRGHNVVLDKSFGPPTITKDGMTVAKEIQLGDPFENMGAQMGSVLHGRVAMAPVDGEGQRLHEARNGDPAAAGADDEIPCQLAWDTTMFGAARDGGAGRGSAWPRECSTKAFGSWRTQGRWIAITAAWLGLVGGDSDGWPLTGPLGVPALTLREACVAYARAEGYVDRGRAVALPLEALSTTGPKLLDLRLLAGFAAGRWGEVRRWHPRAGQLRHVARLAGPP